MTDAEWAHIKPLIPLARRGGNRRRCDGRDLVSRLMYILSTGCQRRAIPKDLPARPSLQDYLELWNYVGALERIHHTL